MDWSWLDQTISVGELLLALGIVAGIVFMVTVWRDRGNGHRHSS